MALTIDSTIGTLLNNQQAKEILDKHCPGMTSDPRLKMAMGMTLKQIMPLSRGKLTLSQIDAVKEELEKL
jgi:hypothetical protein